MEISLLNLAPPLPFMRFVGTDSVFEHPITELLIAESLRIMLPVRIYRLLIVIQAVLMISKLLQPSLMLFIMSKNKLIYHDSIPLLIEISQIRKILSSMTRTLIC